MNDRTPLYLSDEPVDNATLFNVDRVVNALLEVIVSDPVAVTQVSPDAATAPLNVCISGGWGSGKTTVLRTLKRRLSDRAAAPSASEPNPTRYIPIWFDPWKLSTEVEVRDSLTRRVMAEVEADASFMERATIAVARKNVVRLLSERWLKVDPDKMNAFYRIEATARGSFDEVEDLFRRVAKTYLDDEDGTRRRIVVLIDDLDRCRPPRVVEVLEAVKLFFDLPGITFIFALDREQVEDAVATAYGFANHTARVYLEKIFQLALALPRKSATDLGDFVAANLGQLGIVLENRALTLAIVDRFGRNLRNLKRFLNSLSLQRTLLSGELPESDHELLFKWWYLETSIPRSLTEAFKEGALSLVLAFELLAFGGWLHDPLMHSRYVHRLRRSTVDHVALVALAMLPEDAVPATAIHLTPIEQSVIQAIRADGQTTATLNVLREGDVRLIDRDLQLLAMTTRFDLIDDPPTDEDAERRLEAGILEPLGMTRPLAAGDWNRLGDGFLEQENLRAAYIAYLMAALHSPHDAMYLTDLARALRLLGKLQACRALLRRASELEPDSPHVIIELSYLYDVTLRNAERGSALYWLSIAKRRWSYPATLPGNLSHNLARAGDSEMAYLAAVDAYIRDPDKARRRDAVLKRARTLGKIGDQTYERWHEDLEAAIRQGRYPRHPGPAVEDWVRSEVASFPDLSSGAAAGELSRPPL